MITDVIENIIDIEAHKVQTKLTNLGMNPPMNEIKDSILRKFTQSN